MSTAIIDSKAASNAELVAQEFASHTAGKLEQPQISAVTTALKQQTSSYGANGSVASFIFYLQFDVTVKGGKTFKGQRAESRAPAEEPCSETSTPTTCRSCTPTPTVSNSKALRCT